MLISVLVVACTPTPTGIEACLDPACRQEWAVEQWPVDSESVTAAVNELADPIDRIAVVTRLAEAWPGQTASLCAALQPGPARSRCDQLNNRPHLFTPRQPPRSDPARIGSGPAGPSRVPPIPWVSSLVEVTASTGVCLEPTPSACRSQQAALAIQQRQPEQAVAWCQAIGEALWRDECLFVSAQQLADIHGAPAYAQAVDLCALAGDFIGDCFAHLSNTLRPHPAPRTHDWDGTASIAATITQTWATHDPRFGGILVDHFWAASVWRRYGQRGVVLGAPEDAPDEMQAHIRTTSAINLLRIEDPQHPQTLAVLTRQLIDVLAQPRPRTRRPEQAHWAVTLEGDRWPSDADAHASEIPALVYPGGARRPTDDDAETDAVLALLEAAAYMEPPRQDLIEQAAADPRAIVAWSAGRLGSEDQSVHSGD